MTNILIIRPDMMGDAILITPAIALLREKYRNAKITVLGRPYTKEIFTNNPHVDEFIEDWFADNRVKSIKDFREYSDFIKKHRFDISIHFYNELPYAFLTFLAGIKTRIGDTSKPLISPFYNKKSNMRWGDLTLHEVEHNILLLKPLGINLEDTPPPLQLKTPEESVARFRHANNILPQDFVVGIHLGTGRGNKAWLPERYAKVIDYLIQNHRAKVILTGGNKETPAVREVLRLCRSKPINLVGKTTISELIAITSTYRMFIGVDTGPMHIAAALKIPIVAISPTKFSKPAEWGPWQTPHVIIRKATMCHQKCQLPECPFDDCLKSISEEDVIEGINLLLEKRGNQTLAQAKQDWFKKSINVFTNRDEILRELSLNGYNAIEIGIADSPSKLSNQMIKEDINIIHWVGFTKPWALTVAKFLATPSLPIPPQLIFEKHRGDYSPYSLIEFYKKKFRS